MKNCVVCGRRYGEKLKETNVPFIVWKNPCICSECITMLGDKLDDSLTDFYLNDERESEQLHGDLGLNFPDIDEEFSGNKNENHLDIHGSSKGKTMDTLDSLRAVIAEVRKSVRCQDNAVYKVGRTFYRNDKAYEYNSRNPSERRMTKENMIVIGPTGTGKTMIMTEFCKQLGRPYVIADMTTYTSPGYKGGDIEDIFLRLLNVSGGDARVASRGVIILDEGDKKEERGESNFFNKDVMDALLKKIEGSEIDLGNGRFINSTNMIFALVGVYPNVYKAREERLSVRRSIGFGGTEVISSEYKGFIADDFERGGFSSELIGRCPVIVELNKFSDEGYLDLIRNSSDSVVIQYKKMFKQMYNVDLEVTHSGERYIIQRTRKFNTGARGLQRAVVELLDNVEMSFIKEEGQYKKIVIGEEGKVAVS